MSQNENLTPEEKALLIEARYHKARRDLAWAEILATDAGQIVLAEILYRLHHGEAVTDPTAQALQQVAWQILADAKLIQFNPGSLPVEYVSTLTKHKLERDEWVRSLPERRPGLFGRLFGRKAHVR